MIDERSRNVFVTGLLAATAFLATSAYGEEFDNPRSQEAPCVVLNMFEVSGGQVAEDGQTFTGVAMLENVCGRAVELHFCFKQAIPQDQEGISPACFAGPIRPWGKTRVEEAGAAARIVAPDYKWRYLPLVSG